MTHSSRYDSSVINSHQKSLTSVISLWFNDHLAYSDDSSLTLSSISSCHVISSQVTIKCQGSDNNDVIEYVDLWDLTDDWRRFDFNANADSDVDVVSRVIRYSLTVLVFSSFFFKISLCFSISFFSCKISSLFCITIVSCAFKSRKIYFMFWILSFVSFRTSVRTRFSFFNFSNVSRKILASRAINARNSSSMIINHNELSSMTDSTIC
jgi:hypothetical protein